MHQRGVLVVTVGKYVAVWTEQDDGPWKVRVDCFDADAHPVTTEGT
jgi:hypothetical protein